MAKIAHIVTEAVLDLGGVDDFEFIKDPKNIRALIDGLRETADYKARAVGGRVLTDRIPEFTGPTPAIDPSDGADVLLYAIKWAVEVPEKFDVVGESLRETYKWSGGI